MRSPNPASGLRPSALAISALMHAPVTPVLPLSPIDTAVRPFVQKIARLVAVRSEQFEWLTGSCAGLRVTAPPQSGRVPFESEEKDRLKRRKNRLQLRGDPHGLKLLQLISVEDRYELSEKDLLCLPHLLLQRVDLDHQYSHLRWVAPG